MAKSKKGVVQGSGKRKVSQASGTQVYGSGVTYDCKGLTFAKQNNVTGTTKIGRA